MAPITQNAPDEDELDAILDDIINGDYGNDANMTSAPPITSSKRKLDSGNDVLGIEEEIQIVKERRKIPKLDEERLLSDAGIPRLRRISKDRLRFKGKGHEYGDIACMLNMYQLWLDDLYPRAKLADGLAIIEKMGHKKRLQYMRKEWIQEGKPKNTVEADEEEDDGADGALDKPDQDQEQTEGDSFSNDARPDEQRNENTLRADIGAVGALEQEEPDEDELDALLAEDYATVNRPMTSTALPSRTTFEDDPFADDEAAMAEFEGT